MLLLCSLRGLEHVPFTIHIEDLIVAYGDQWYLPEAMTGFHETRASSHVDRVDCRVEHHSCGQRLSTMLRDS